MQRINIKANYIGLDLGQRRDHTALAAISAVEWIVGRDPVTYNWITHREFRLTQLDRIPLNVPYTKVPGVARKRVIEANLTAKVTVAVDASGPGLPVADLLRNAQLPASILPVMITGGSGNSKVPSKGVYTVPRKDLLSLLRITIESGRLKGARHLPLRGEFLSELAHIDAESASHTRNHDDLVFAVALALWAANIRNPHFLKTADLAT
jgi:hypothetical protein